jgi:hypothetical protein
MAEQHRQSFTVRDGGSHTYDIYGRELNPDGTLVVPPEPDYHVAENPEQIIVERKRQRYFKPQITTHEKKEEDSNVNSETLRSGKG